MGRVLHEKKIVHAVTGSIAIYKAPEIIRELRTKGAEVTVLMSPGARQFMSELVFQTLTEKPVFTDHFKMTGGGIDHIEVTRGAHAFLVAPATANTIARFAAGLADEILSSSYLAYSGPVIMAPAMNTRMWNHPATKENVKILKKRGVQFVNPGSGWLACGEEGEGRLAPVDDIVLEVMRATLPQVLKGKKVLVTGGATREYLDPVRFLTNGSTGIMGVELAKMCYALGGDVKFITGVSHPQVPSQISFEEIVSAEELLKAVQKHLSWCDVLIMSAAVADFTPAKKEKSKIKKSRGEFKLTLKRTKDILAEVSAKKGKRVFIGFSAETEKVIENSRQKLKNKKLDWIIANEVPESFGSGRVKGWVISSKGDVTELRAEDKEEFAFKMLTEIFKD